MYLILMFALNALIITLVLMLFHLVDMYEEWDFYNAYCEWHDQISNTGEEDAFEEYYQASCVRQMEGR